MHPNLGVVRLEGSEFILADIPGLIEGAHEGHGLGDRFLGHVERTAVLLHVIDGTQDDIVQAYRTIRHELQEYGQELGAKEEIIALNKCDALGPELAEDQAKTLEEAIGKKVHQISTVSTEGLRPLALRPAGKSRYFPPAATPPITFAPQGERNEA